MKPPFDTSCQLVWAIANTEAVLSGADSIRPVHLLLGVLKAMDPGILKHADNLGLSDVARSKLANSVKASKQYLELSDARVTRVRRTIRTRVRNGRQLDSKAEIGILHRTDESRAVFTHAQKVAVSRKIDAVALEHLLEALFETGTISLKDLRDYSKPSSDGARWAIG